MRLRSRLLLRQHSMRRIETTSQFRKDLKKYRHQVGKLKKIYYAISLLAEGQDIPASMRPHKLIGNYAGHLELHIEGDLLLIWLETDNRGETIVYLTRVGTHSELFG